MFLKACLNGARTRADHPRLPASPSELARDVVAASAAGAAAVHVHVKDHQGIDTFDDEALAATLASVRGLAPGIPVGVTTGAWALPDPAERVAAIEGWRVTPDFASVNWHEEGADEVAQTLLDRDVGVEAGLWHLDAVEAWAASPVRDRCLRVLVELPDGLDEAGTVASAEELLRAVRAVAGGSIPVLLHGEGTSCWPALRYAAALGLPTRIGLEDTLWLPDGTTAPDNAALVRALPPSASAGPDAEARSGADLVLSRRRLQPRIGRVAVVALPHPRRVVSDSIHTGSAGRQRCP